MKNISDYLELADHKEAMASPDVAEMVPLDLVYLQTPCSFSKLLI